MEFNFPVLSFNEPLEGRVVHKQASLNFTLFFVCLFVFGATAELLDTGRSLAICIYLFIL